MRIRLDKLIKSEIDELIAECNFTDDEEEVVKYKSKGKTNIEISYLMCVSQQTVERKYQNALVKIKKVQATK